MMLGIVSFKWDFSAPKLYVLVMHKMVSLLLASKEEGGTMDRSCTLEWVVVTLHGDSRNCS